MITSVHDIDDKRWQATSLKHLETLIAKIRKDVGETAHSILSRKDYLGYLPIYHAINRGAGKKIVAYMKEIMIQGGTNQKFLNNITDEGMVTGLHECDTDFSNSWKKTSAEHVQILVKYTKKPLHVVLSHESGRWNNIPIFYSVYYCAPLSVVQYMFENNREATLAWRSNTGSTLVHYAAIWDQSHLIPYLLFMYGLDIGLNTQDEEGMTPVDLAREFSRNGALAALQSPFRCFREYIFEKEDHEETRKKFNAKFEEFMNLIEQDHPSQRKPIEKFYTFYSDPGEDYIDEFLDNCSREMCAEIDKKNELIFFQEGGPKVCFAHINFFKVWNGESGSLTEEKQDIIWELLQSMHTLAYHYIKDEENQVMIDIDGFLQDYNVLHAAIILNAEIDIVQHILNTQTRLATTEDKLGRMPVHCIPHNMNLKDISSLNTALLYYETMFSADPGTSIIVDPDGHLPMHIICDLPYRKKDPPNMAVQDLHLKLIQVIFYAMPPEFEDDMDRNRQKLIQQYCAWPKAPHWGNLLGATYDRYRIVCKESPIQKSRHFELQNAVDLVKLSKPLVKLMVFHEKWRFEKEISARLVGNNKANESADRDDGIETVKEYAETMRQCAVNILGWHLPPQQHTDECNHQEEGNKVTREEEKMSESSHASSPKCIPMKTIRKDIIDEYQRPESTDGENEFVLILEPYEKSLETLLRSQDMVSRSMSQARDIFRQIVHCTKTLHMLGYVHGNLKPRTIAQLVDSKEGMVQYKILELSRLQKHWSMWTPPTNCLDYSTAYLPPECVRHIFSVPPITEDGSHGTVTAKPSMDVWSLGMILYELCSGRTVFPMNSVNDNLINKIDITRICTWDTIPESMLEQVFRDIGKVEDESKGDTDTMLKDAKNMIRWCLKGSEKERPSLQEICDHRFVALPQPTSESESDSEESDSEVIRPIVEPEDKVMVFHCYITHDVQSYLSNSISRELRFNLQRFGINVWTDEMPTETRLQGIREGVKSCKVLIAIMTEFSLLRKCFLEAFLTAIDEDIPIQLVVEQNRQLSPFDIDEEGWHTKLIPKGFKEKQIAAFKAADAEVQKAVGLLKFVKADAESTRDVGELEEDIKQRQKILDACKKTINDMENNEKIVQRIKDCWENAIPYRRAAHEQTAMVREISLRCSWTLPIRPDRNADWEYLKNVKPRCKVFAIFNPLNADDMFGVLKEEIRYVRFMTVTDSPEELSRATSVIIILSRNLRQAKKREKAIMKVLQDDKKLNHFDRLITLCKVSTKDSTAMYGEDDGWVFGGEEQMRSPAEIKQALTNHEPIAYRPNSIFDGEEGDEDRSEISLANGPYRHEFMTMKYELLKRIREMHEKSHPSFKPNKKK
jgi:serine/threonine protein kinase